MPSLALSLLFLQHIHQLDRREEAYPPMVMLNGLNTERCGNVGLACSWSSDQNHIVGILQKFASMQLTHQRFIYFAVAKLKYRRAGYSASRSSRASKGRFKKSGQPDPDTRGIGLL